MNLKVLFLLMPLTCFGQEDGKRIVRQTHYENGKLESEFFIGIFNGDTLFDGPYVRYYPSGVLERSASFVRGIVVGEEVFYDKKGRITFRHTYDDIAFPRTIKGQSYYYSGACRYAEGTLLETQPGVTLNYGVAKWYRKDQQVMDSVVYENGVQVYRAAFSKKGLLQFEKTDIQE